MKNRTLFKILSILVMLTVLAAGACVHASAEKTDGVLLRVLLRRLNISTRISAKTAGSCLLKGGSGTEMLLQTDTAFDVELRENQLVVFTGGASLSFGKKNFRGKTRRNPSATMCSANSSSRWASLWHGVLWLNTVNSWDCPLQDCEKDRDF